MTLDEIQKKSKIGGSEINDKIFLSLDYFLDLMGLDWKHLL
jgi:hypothetical protein